MIPLHKMAMSPLIGLLLLSSLWNFKKPKKSDLIFLWIVLYYLILIVGYFNSSNKGGGISELENNAAFVILPIVFAISNINFKNIATRVLTYFLEGLILSVFIAFCFSGIKFISGEGVSSFFYGEISPFHHTSYSAMYASFGIAYLYYIAFHPKRSTFIPSKFTFLLITTLSIYVLLLLSKTGILVTFMIHIISITFWIVKHKKLKLGLVTLSLILASVSVSLIASDSMRNRFFEVFTALGEEEHKESSTGSRIISWDASWELFREQPILGVGTGDINESMSAKFIEKGHNSLALKRLNSHNQYLTTLTKSGLLGFFSLLLLFLIPVFISKKQNSYIFLVFTFIVGINFLTESVLQIQSGIIFVAFFISFFYAMLMDNIQINPTAIEVPQK